MRRRGGGLVGALVLVLAVAGCGGSSQSNAGRASKPVGANHVVTLGCGDLCEQAGASGAPPGAARSPIRLDTTGIVVPSPAGVVPVTFSCAASVQCQGAILFIDRDAECSQGPACLGRSDLIVGAHTTRTLGVKLSALGAGELGRYGRMLVDVDVLVGRYAPAGGDITVALSQTPPKDEIAVGNNPGAIAVGAPSAWVANFDDGTLTRLNAATGAVVGSPSKVGSSPSALAVGGRSVWVGEESSDRVVRLSARSGRPDGKPILAPQGPDELATGLGSLWVGGANDGDITRIAMASGRVVGRPIKLVGSGPLAFADGSLWVSNGGSEVRRVDAATGKVITVIRVPEFPQAMTAGRGRVWIANGDGATLTEIDADTGKVLDSHVPGGGFPISLALAGRTLWILDQKTGSVAKLNTATLALTPEVDPVGLLPAQLAIGAGSVWVVNGGSNSVTRIDAATGAVQDR